MRNLKFIFTVLLAVASESVFSQTERAHIDLEFDNTTNCRLRYYYYPNLEAYFDNEKGLYMYRDKGRWITAREIPSGYRGYGLYNKAHTPINDYDDDDPIQFFDQHKKKYPYNCLKRTRTLTASVN